MKRIILPLIFLFIALKGSANENNKFPFFQFVSNLTLSTMENGVFLYEVNGVNYTPVNKVVHLRGLNQGVERIVIYQYRPNYYGTGQWVPVFNGNIQVPPNANVFAKWNSWNGMVVSINRFGQNNYTQNPNFPQNPQNPQNPNYPNYPNNPNYPGHPNIPQNPNYPNNNNVPPVNPNYPNNNIGYGMSVQTYQGLITQIQNASFDNNKVTIAKMAIKSNSISVNQLKGVLSELSFDSNRLDVAKFAYPYCVDKNNYFLLNDSFEFSSNASDLMKSIGK